ncbi:MAG TPA: enoyl-CoA hydratase family protein [Hellea balneolensis]|uniref:Enoyl-CoA hydratase family protein n=1 Tax=Hellea balneolensis TaxID=287478 RepID=A0A7C3FZ43_9PROT|nr:enoyl-CoA hydratase family protein [Hellea balneolensis]
MTASNFNPSNFDPKTFKPEHFLWSFQDGIATIALDNPAQKNPLTFQSYAELRDTFRHLCYVNAVKVIVFGSNEGNFCSGGNVHDIIGPLTQMNMGELLNFTRMTGDLIKAMRNCPQPIIAAVDGISVGAGAIISMASDLRLATPNAKTAFLFNRVGLAGCDMGACAILPRIIGQTRASELLFLGRSMSAEEGERWGYFNKIIEPEHLHTEALKLANRIASGPTFANSITKNQLNMEWDMSLDTAIEAEAQAQAICMQTEDFRRAFDAFVTKQKPVFKGN